MDAQKVKIALTNGKQIAKIKVKGFKSILDAEIDLGMLNVLIGANGAGKGNFISIFKLLKGMNTNKIQSYITQQGGLESILYMGSKTTPDFGVRMFWAGGRLDDKSVCSLRRTV